MSNTKSIPLDKLNERVYNKHLLLSDLTSSSSNVTLSFMNDFDDFIYKHGKIIALRNFIELWNGIIIPDFLDLKIGDVVYNSQGYKLVCTTEPMYRKDDVVPSVCCDYVTIGKKTSITEGVGYTFYPGMLYGKEKRYDYDMKDFNDFTSVSILKPTIIT